jgi:Cu(I)/Ag(I) efflux system membrane fusion protein
MKSTLRTLTVLVAAAALFLGGRWSAPADGAAPDDGPREPAAPSAAAPTLWTCPMHPQIKLPDAGDCPICGMDLVRLSSDGDGDPRQLVMSPASRALARVETEPVRRRFVTRPVRMVGKIDYDERAVRSISAWVPGRIDRLFVDYTGIRVEAGDHLVRLYSPDLFTAQEELLGARARLAGTASEASAFLAESNRRAYESARQKLILWGLTAEQVDAILARGTAEEHVTLTSPVSGVVIQKRLEEGAYVQTGTPVYEIADLSHLWVRLDAYEQDLPWLRYGQAVVLETEALPGELFEGRIVVIDPFIDERTRTAKVRVNIDNTDGRLKPGMFVRAVAAARVGSGGVVLGSELAGKWISPMHPEVVKDGPGQCDVCGMDLVPAEALGLVTRDDALERPLVVPASAVLVTGRRAVVYVEVPDAERPTYEGREVTLGPRAGDEYIVLAGLEEGERIVTHGAFRIDSSMQILARPSMMGMPGERGVLAAPEAHMFRAALAPLYDGYLALHAALAGDDEPGARAALQELATAHAAVSGAALPARHRTIWSEERAALGAALESARRAGDIDALRAAFRGLSTAVLELERAFGHAGGGPRFEAHCPMAFDGEGAAWMQAGETLLNPYFGASMLRCGEERERFAPADGRDDAHDAAPDDAAHDDAAPDDAAPDEAAHDDAAPDDAAPDEAAHDDGAHDDAAPELGDAREVVRPLFVAYLALQRALAADDADGARGALRDVTVAAAAAQAAPRLDERLVARLAEARAHLDEVPADADLARARAAFGPLSDALLAIESVAGNPLPEPLHVMHCPMARDGAGGDWLQAEELLANPYFGAQMLRCGETLRTSRGGPR